MRVLYQKSENGPSCPACSAPLVLKFGRLQTIPWLLGFVAVGLLVSLPLGTVLDVLGGGSTAENQDALAFLSLSFAVAGVVLMVASVIAVRKATLLDLVEEPPDDLFSRQWLAMLYGGIVSAVVVLLALLVAYSIP